MSTLEWVLFLSIEWALISALIVNYYWDKKWSKKCKNTYNPMETNEKKKEKKEIEQVKDDNFAGWLEDLEQQDQPTCNLDDPEDCEACGS